MKHKKAHQQVGYLCYFFKNALKKLPIMHFLVWVYQMKNQSIKVYGCRIRMWEKSMNILARHQFSADELDSNNAK